MTPFLRHASGSADDLSRRNAIRLCIAHADLAVAAPSHIPPVVFTNYSKPLKR